MGSDSGSYGFVRIGDVIDERYKISRALGAGGYGIVFSCFDPTASEQVAVKFEQNASHSTVLREKEVMLAASSCGHVVNLRNFGKWKGRNYIVMDHLGLDLRRAMGFERGRVYSPVKLAFVGKQMVQAVKELHEIGYFHNDVKPSNFAFGGAPTGPGKTLYVFDLGLARKVTEEKDKRCDRLRGTLHYASIGAHLRRTSNPWDDVHSIFYSLIYLATGALPWIRTRNELEVLYGKRELNIHEIVNDRYESILKMSSYLDSTDSLGSPDYDTLIAYFDNELKRIFVE